MCSKKAQQLGMHPSTAGARLLKDLLWKFIVDTGANSCHHCGKSMSREDFSIEHKTPWLDSSNPVELYFNMDNIGYSHLSCNVRAARRKVGFTHGTTCGYDNYGCRCPECKKAKAERSKRSYTKEKRREIYTRLGK